MDKYKVIFLLIFLFLASSVRAASITSEVTSSSDFSKAYSFFDRKIICVEKYIKSDDDEESNIYEFHFEEGIPFILFSTTLRDGNQRIEVSSADRTFESLKFKGKFPWADISYEFNLNLRKNIKSAVKQLSNSEGKEIGNDPVFCYYN